MIFRDRLENGVGSLSTTPFTTLHSSVRFELEEIKNVTIVTSPRGHQDVLAADVFSWNELPELMAAEELFDAAPFGLEAPATLAGRDEDEDEEEDEDDDYDDDDDDDDDEEEDEDEDDVGEDDEEWEEVEDEEEDDEEEEEEDEDDEDWEDDEDEEWDDEDEEDEDEEDEEDDD